MVTFRKQPDKEAKQSIAGRAPREVKEHVDRIAKKYNMTPSQVLCEILTAWHNGDTFKKEGQSKLSNAAKRINQLEREVAIRKESVALFIRNYVADEGDYESWANTYNDALKKARKKFK